MARSKKLSLDRILKQYDLKGSKSLQRAAYRAAVEKAEKIKKEAIDELNKHKVTTEIEAGPNVNNSSLLGGRGSLFGFLGFQKSAQPVTILREAFTNMFTVNKNKGKVKKVSKRRFTLEYEIKNVPSIVDIYKITPLPWTSKSWVKGIERGITNYTQTVFKDSQNSRSGVAVQTNKQINFIRFSPVPYVSEILKNAKKKFK